MKKVSNFVLKKAKERNALSEFQRFKENIKLHKYKILVITTGALFPFYKPYLLDLSKKAEYFFAKKLEKKLHKEEKIPKITEAFLKQTINDVLMDQTVRFAGLDFAQDLIAQRVIIDAVVRMLLHAIQDPIFLEKVQILGQNLGQEIINDEDVKRDVVKLMTRVFQDEEIIFEAGELVKKISEREDVSKSMTNTVAKVLSTDEANDAMKKLLEECFNRVMLEPETIEKFRIFAYNLMTAEIEGKGNKNSLFDMMVKKMISRRQESNQKKSEIEDILDQEINQKIEARKKAEIEIQKKRDEDIGRDNAVLDKLEEENREVLDDRDDEKNEISKLEILENLPKVGEMNLNSVFDDDTEED